MGNNTPRTDILKLGAINTTAVLVDLSDIAHRIVLPEISREELEDFGFDLSRYATREDEAHGADATSIQLDRAREDFEASEFYEEWGENFAPAMNYLWPCAPSNPEKAAQLMGIWAPNTSLIETQDTDDVPRHYIAMTAGGTDLSHHLAMAYICCGHIPPYEIMSGVLQRDPELDSERKRMIADAAARAEEHLMRQSANMEKLKNQFREKIEPATPKM